jgi:hypothetical protein
MINIDNILLISITSLTIYYICFRNITLMINILYIIDLNNFIEYIPYILSQPNINDEYIIYVDDFNNFIDYIYFHNLSLMINIFSHR